MNQEFNAKKVKEELIQWIRKYFADTVDAKYVYVIGISGGIDSSVCAALGCEALGANRVIGVLMPQGEQKDIDCSYQLCKHLNIPYEEINIEGAVDAIYAHLSEIYKIPVEELPPIVTTNTPARVRMAILYAIAGMEGGRVVNTCNLSEDYVGYSTKFGDSAGDLSPLMMLTKTEVKLLAKELNLPENLATKPPTDGMCGQTDEERFGFTYETLDNYIRYGIEKDPITTLTIDKMHINNLHKLMPQMPHYEYNPNTVEEEFLEAFNEIPDANKITESAECETNIKIISELKMVTSVLNTAITDASNFPIEFKVEEWFHEKTLKLLELKGYKLTPTTVLYQEGGVPASKYTITKLEPR